MSSVGAAAGAASAAGRSPAIPLASLARVKAESSLATEGDRLLAGREFPPTAVGQAYCHNAHGLTVTPDEGVVSMYTHEPVSGLKPIQVPVRSAYVSAVLVGTTMGSETEELHVFYKLWGDSSNSELFKNIGRADADGEHARAFVEGALAPFAPVDGYSPKITIHPGTYPPSLIYPFCAWRDEPGPGGEETFAYARSGIVVCGTKGCDQIIELHSCGVQDMNDGFIKWMFEGSLFPTVAELLGDAMLRKIREDRSLEDVERYYAVHDYINGKWRCSQEQLFIKLPGAHYSLICRTLVNESYRANMAAPHGSRRLPGRAVEALSSATTAAATAGAFTAYNVAEVNMKKGMGRRTRRTRRRTQRSKRRTHKNRK